MTDRPTAADLLATARIALLDELLPLLPPRSHYTARMVANAMAIAAREVAAAPLAAEIHAELASLAGVPTTAGLDVVARLLTVRLRNRDFAADARLRERLHCALLAWTEARLAISDPRTVGRSSRA